MRNQPLRVLLVDDHAMVLEGLKAVLGRFRGRVRVIGQALDADEAQCLVSSLEPDVVLVDVRLRGSMSGLDLCRRLIEAAPDRKVVLLSAYDDEQYLFQAMRAGAAGYLLKSIGGEELVRHLELAATGEKVVDPGMAGRAVASAARLQAGEFWPGAHLSLTQRESEVLGHLVAGLSNRAIAAKLVLGEETIKSHVRAIFRKLDVNDRAGAVATALREGIFQ
ncbi:response regulator transcription factor [Amycolatopsis sp. K13G38]|uniref:Response regulator transcription factor n=1 Tax=Amycolatopsis acididurans TaxID=2724524 RepID=A0ABX1J3J7_9PSEU|nr:response regulator transcription factor [Amycolatopsis acididurans]NKQ54363.1 response regulator transcription factor [Amycolatopsis acididurans]